MTVPGATAPPGIAFPPVWLPLLFLAGLVVSPLLLLLAPAARFAHQPRTAFSPGVPVPRAPLGGVFSPAPPRSPPL